ncbi:MAG: restriction endonuclease subunit S [Bacteroidales bacterium]|nr:restriction endonuclease subunit S [Bacteroidales bacterium]
MSEWKETDFGKIPNHWELKKVIDIKSNDKRAIAMGPFGSNIKVENFVEYGVPIIRGTNLNFSKYVDGEFVFLTEEKADELIGSNCKSGDLVFTHRGTIGQVGLVPSKFPRYVISQSGMKLSVNPDLIDNEFLFYFFKSEFGQFQILKYESQVGVPAISNPLTSLKEIEVPVPPINEQKFIASILSSLDDKIDLLHRQNATLEKMAETLFRKWFVAEAKAKDEWKKGKVGDLINILSGFAFKSNLFVESGKYRLITIKGVQDGYLDLNNADKIEEVPDRMPDFCKLEIGDIILSLTGNVGRCCLVDTTDLLLNQRVAKLHPINERNRAYTYFLFRQPQIKQLLEEMGKGTAQSNLSPIETSNMELIIPDEEKIIEFSLMATPLLNKLLCNKKSIQNLTALRDTLLPKLISGEIGVIIN